MLCILYVTAVGVLLGATVLAIEPLLPDGWARRWLWAATIPVSVVLPGYYRWHHSWSVTAGASSLTPSSLPHAMAMGPVAPFGPEWWARIDALNPMINRVWLLISGFLVIMLVINAMRVWHVVDVARTRRNDHEKPNVVDGIPILVTDQLGPATVGVVRSRVLIPRWVLALPGTQRHYVLRHEEEHRRAHDAGVLFLASLPILLMPWNLAMWWQLRRLRLAIEMDCDRRVVAALGNERAYGELLLKVAQASSRGPHLQPAFLGGPGTLEQRLRRLVAPTRLRLIQKVLLPVLAFTLLCVVLAMPHPIVGSDSHQHAGMSSNATNPQHETFQR